MESRNEARSMTALLAQASTAGTTVTRTSFEFGRMHSFTHLGHWALLVGGCLAVLWFVWHMYRRDSVGAAPGDRRAAGLAAHGRVRRPALHLSAAAVADR